MVWLPVTLVLLSAFIHAYWNMQLKRAEDKVLLTFIYVWAAVIIYIPVTLLLLPGHEIPWEGLACAVSTGLTYSAYFLLLARSYSLGDLSHAYPLARGVAPVLTLVWAVAFLSENPTTTGYAGIFLVIISVFLFHPPRGRVSLHGISSRLREPASAAALATALCISVYSVIDKVGVSYIYPPIYIHLTFLIGGTLLIPHYLRRYGGRAIIDGFRLEWRRGLLIGFLCIFAYMIVLFAMRLTEVSYILPIRSTSILFAMLLGQRLLQEERTALRNLAALLMAAGVILIALH
jgi:drug/metabolite transporter (DMT)-like permease